MNKRRLSALLPFAIALTTVAAAWGSTRHQVNQVAQEMNELQSAREQIAATNARVELMQAQLNRIEAKVDRQNER